MSTYADTLNAERLHAAARMRQILDGAKEANRSLTAEENEALDKASADYDRLKFEQARVDAVTERLTESESIRLDLTPVTAQTREATESHEDNVYGAVRSLTSAIKSDAISLRRKPEVVDFEYKVDLKKIAEAQRAISDFANGASLYMNDFATNVALFQRTASPLINLATVITADNGRPLVLPNMTADPTTVSPGESTAISENSGTQGSATATPLGYKTLSYISAEADEDEQVQIAALIAKAQGRSLGIYGGTAMTASLLTAASNGGTATGVGGGSTATFLGYEDFIDLKMGRAVPYRQVGAWLMSNGAIKKARKWTDKNGQYLWQPAIAQGQPDLFDGDPVYEDPGLATPASATKSVLYGDLSAWVIKQRPLRVAVSTEFKFDTDQIAIRTVWRVGGALPDTAAIAYLVSANA